MSNVTFATQRDSVFRILCLGAHSDDIEIGCGGTILRWLDEYPSAEVYWIVMGASGNRRAEAVRSADMFLANTSKKEIVVKEFTDGYFPYVVVEIKDFFEDLKRKYLPDVILTHYREDLHQDHRLVSELTWNTFRSPLILEDEIVKYDGNLSPPKFFFHMTESLSQRKNRMILDVSQC